MKKPKSTPSLPNDERPTDPMPPPVKTEGAGTINRLLEEVDYFTALGLYEEALMRGNPGKNRGENHE